MTRAPVSVLYGGAHLFKADTRTKLAAIAQKTFAEHGRALIGDDDALYACVQAKLQTEAVEDFRIDFEDGYGVRSDAEEDAHAQAAANALAPAPFGGIRLNKRRPARTLRIFLDAGFPENFVVTLPKLDRPQEVQAIVRLLDAHPGVGLELMVETPTMLQRGLAAFLLFGEGRVRALHFGAYDYLSALDIAADAQSLLHPLCDHARTQMKLAVAGTDVRLSDGATSSLPLGSGVFAALQLHVRHIEHALAQGIYQGWDLHPAQLVARHIATQRFFSGALDKAKTRLQAFVAEAARARQASGVFDDAATARGVAVFLLQGLSAGAFTPADTGFAADTLVAYSSGVFA